jgi:predicted DNA-binding transcriptional regulator AlpA
VTRAAGAVERKADVLARLPVVFGLSAAEAAAAVGVSATFFRTLVAERRMPQPRTINGRRVWDVDELRAAFKALPHEQEAEDVDEWAGVG